MEKVRRPGPSGHPLILLATALLAIGCHAAPGGPDRNLAGARSLPTGDTLRVPYESEESVIQVANRYPLAAAGNMARATDQDPFADTSALEVDALVDEVLKRNPSVPALVSAWQVAAERYPQVISLDDPTFGFMLGPGTFGNSAVDFAWMVNGSQKLPWPGKLRLRGNVVHAEASAAFQDIEELRLRLTEAAKVIFFDYYVVHRQIEVNEDNIRRVQEFRDISQTKYESNLVTQQDVFQAEVELAELEKRRVELERTDRVARARINTLLHRAPDHALPPPPTHVGVTHSLPPAQALRQMAIERRPDLAAKAARIRAEEAAVELAAREFYPDFEIMARYDGFWQERELRPMVGLNLNLPIQLERRRAAVREAIARVTRERAEFEQLLDQIQYEVHAAFERVNESHRVVDLYAKRIIPAAKDNLESARAGYIAGRVDFLRLIEAQRQLYGHQEKQYDTVADHHRRLAELERVLAGPITTAAETRSMAPPNER